MKKRILATLLVLCAVVGMLPTMITTAHASTNGYSQADAVAWILGSEGTANDFIHDGSIECVDLVKWYINTLGHNLGSIGYAYNLYRYTDTQLNLPSWSWSRHYNDETPQPGDIVVLDAGAFGAYGAGHCGLIYNVDINTGKYFYIDYNGGGNHEGGTKREKPLYNFSCVIRPDWPSSQPTAPSQYLGNDFYAYIRNPHSGHNLENRSNNVQLATANSYDPRQIWHFIHLGNNQYKIVNMYDGRCLDTNGSSVQVLPYVGTAGQKWSMCGTGSYTSSRLYYMVPPVYSTDHRLVLDVVYGNDAYVPAGRNVSLNQSWYGGSGGDYLNGGPFHKAQAFQIQKISNVGTVLTQYARNNLGSDFYARLSYGNTYIQTSGVSVGGERMAVQTTQSSSPTDPKQIWHFIQQSNGSYKIMNEYSGWCLDVSGATAVDGAKVQTWYDDYGHPTERWYVIQSPGERVYRIVSGLAYPGELYSLDVPVAVSGAVPPEGTDMTIVRAHENTNQQFAISKLSDYSPAPPATPTNAQVIAASSSTTISWNSVPEASIYDDRAYEFQLFNNDTNEDVLGGLYRTRLNSYPFDDLVLPDGNYRLEVRAVNCKYPKTSPYYKSGLNVTYFSIQRSCTVSVVSTQGGVSRGSGTYPRGGSVTVTAEPFSGYHFIGWQENGQIVNNNAEYTFTVTGDRNLTAVFEKDPPAILVYSIQVNAGPGGTVTGGGSYQQGSSVTVRAISGDGYQFKEWQENNRPVNTNDSYTFTVTADRDLTAVFEKIGDGIEPQEPVTYTVSVVADPPQGGTVTGGGTYVENTEVQVTAAVGSGYIFSEWKKDGVHVSAESNYTFIVEGNQTLTAVFTPKESAAQTYTVQVRATVGGTASGGGTYRNNESVTVTATANDGYRFVSWKAGDTQVSTDAVYTFFAIADQELTAVFESEDGPVLKLLYDVEVLASPSAGGVASGGGCYEAESTVAVLAVANPGYQFTGWTENGHVVSTESSYTFEVNENKYLTAIFVSKTCSVIVKADPPEGGTVTGSDVYEKGKSVTITAAANSGYQFAGWQRNGETLSDNASYTFTASEDQTFTAVFELQAELPITSYMITVNAVPASGGSVTGGRSYQQGDTASVTAVANSNYRFVRWTENGVQVSTSTNYTFIATADRMLTAVFEQVSNSSIDSSGDSSDNDPTYSVTVPSHASGGTVKVSPTSASSGRRVTITVKPDTGFELDALTVTDSKGAEIVLTDQGDGKYTFMMPNSKVSIELSFRAITLAAPATSIRFTDVQPNAYYYDAVAWAVEQGITSGATSTTFDPDSPCTRAQILSFLWRQAGSPKMSGANLFTDVSATDYYYDAVLWAVANGITAGTGDGTTFSPSEPCTRAQAMTFLYRDKNSPAASGTNSFTDVSASAYYTNAVQWAVANGVTYGVTDTSFGPDQNCTRAQIMSFLYRIRAN